MEKSGHVLPSGGSSKSGIFLRKSIFSTISSGQERTLELKIYWRRSV